MVAIMWHEETNLETCHRELINTVISISALSVPCQMGSIILPVTWNNMQRSVQKNC